MRTRIQHAGPIAWLALTGSLVGCPRIMDREGFAVSGTVLDEAGNAVRPTRVEMRAGAGSAVACSVYFGSFQCTGLDHAETYTLTLERGAEVYTELVSSAGSDCGDDCTLFRPFTLEIAPEGACSPDTLPLVARLVSPRQREIGAIEGVWLEGRPGLEATLLPADAVGPKTWANPAHVEDQSLYAEANLPFDRALAVHAMIRANGAWCAAHGGWSPGMQLQGVALVAFLPQPGSEPCSYTPVELRIGPEHLVDCSN
ncbi:MAG: hypothetical protein ABI895_26390 [Deltaproteobacteria bacterium]